MVSLTLRLQLSRREGAGVKVGAGLSKVRESGKVSGPKWLSHNCADSLARLEQILRFAQNDTWRGAETPPYRTGPRGQAFWGL